MMLHLILLLTVFLWGYISASELRPTSLSAVPQGNGRLYTVRYESDSKPVVVWEEPHLIYNSSTAQMTHSFTEKQGESTFLASFPTTHLLVRLYLQGELSVYYYVMQGIEGEITPPDRDITFPNGQNIVYERGVPFTIPIQYPRETDGETEPELGWYFVGVDNNRDFPIIELASSWDPNIGRYVNNGNKTIKGDNYEVSAQVTLDSQEGIVSVISGANSRAMRLEVLYISLTGSQGPLPPNFIGIFDPYEIWGHQVIQCTHSGCIIHCNGVGSGINRVDLRKAGSETPLVPKLVNPTEWMYTAEYQLFPVEADAGTYICTAYDNKNNSARKEIRGGHAFALKLRTTSVSLVPQGNGRLYLVRYKSFMARWEDSEMIFGPLTRLDWRGPCQNDEATCNNGECIPRDYLCDGENDCLDYSDETNCNFTLTCDPNEFKCADGRCAMKIWRCDGDNDCGDGSDETNCPELE